MSKIDKKAELLKKLQAELDRRTQIEEEAIDLISNGKCEKACDLLNTLEDNIVKEIEIELDQLGAESVKKEAEDLDEKFLNSGRTKVIDADMLSDRTKVIYGIIKSQMERRNMEKEVGSVNTSEKTKSIKTKILLEGVKEYKENMDILRKGITEFREEVRALNIELEQLNSRMRAFVELRKESL